MQVSPLVLLRSGLCSPLQLLLHPFQLSSSQTHMGLRTERQSSTRALARSAPAPKFSSTRLFAWHLVCCCSDQHPLLPDGFLLGLLDLPLLMHLSPHSFAFLLRASERQGWCLISITQATAMELGCQSDSGSRTWVPEPAFLALSSSSTMYWLS